MNWSHNLKVHATIETMLANPVDAADTLPHEATIDQLHRAYCVHVFFVAAGMPWKSLITIFCQDMEAVHPDPMESRRQALKATVVDPIIQLQLKHKEQTLLGTRSSAASTAAVGRWLGGCWITHTKDHTECFGFNSKMEKLVIPHFQNLHF
jgi:hypothetical protein